MHILCQFRTVWYQPGIAKYIIGTFCNVVGRSDIQSARLSPILIAVDVSSVIFLQNQPDSTKLETISPFVQL